VGDGFLLIFCDLMVASSVLVYFISRNVLDGFFFLGFSGVMLASTVLNRRKLCKEASSPSNV
jgi:hypothetical protein